MGTQRKHDDRRVQVKIGTMPGDVMRLMFKRTPPQPGDRITLRHVGYQSHGKRDMLVLVTEVRDGRIFCQRFAEGKGRSRGLD